MQAVIEVNDEEEAEQIKNGLEDAAMRAFVRVTAILGTLPDDASRERVLRATCVLFGLDYPPTRRPR